MKNGADEMNVVDDEKSFKYQESNIFEGPKDTICKYRISTKYTRLTN